MLNTQELLNEIVKILGLELKDIKKLRFINEEESHKQYIKHVNLIKDRLNIQDTTINNILMDLFLAYEKIKNNLINYDKDALQKRINWTILKRLVIPYLAYHFALNKVDFDINLFLNPKKSKTPINNIMVWWIEQTKGNFTDLCNIINTKLQHEGKIESTDPTNTLSEWKYRTEIPKIETIQKYCNVVLGYKNNIKPKNVISRFIIARALQSTYQKLLKYFQFEDTRNIENNKLLQLIYLFDYLYNIQKERAKSNNIDYDLNDLGKTFLNPIININKESPVTRTLFADITIDILKDFDQDILKHKSGECDNIYIIFETLYQESKITNVSTILTELEKDKKYFDDYYEAHFKSNKYLTYSKEEIINKLENESNFQCILYLFKHYKESYQTIDVELAQTYKDKLITLAKTDDEKGISLREQIAFYTSISINTPTNSSDVSNLIKDFRLLLEKKHLLNTKEKNLLYFDACFYLKSKNFKKSFECFNKYFNLYIYNQKKDISTYEILMLCSYTAYILINQGEQGIKKNFKAYNRVLKNLNLDEFKTVKSIPFPMYFYK